MLQDCIKLRLSFVKDTWKRLSPANVYRPLLQKIANHFGLLIFISARGPGRKHEGVPFNALLFNMLSEHSDVDWITKPGDIIQSAFGEYFMLVECSDFACVTRLLYCMSAGQGAIDSIPSMAGWGFSKPKLHFGDRGVVQYPCVFNTPISIIPNLSGENDNQSFHPWGYN